MTKKQIFLLFLFSPVIVPVAIATMLAKIIFETIKQVWAQA
jgi:hypothetical protein